ncbi:MAG TPA: penicillin-binding protein 2 [Candidatus Limnocylindrales bacterium]
MSATVDRRPIGGNIWRTGVALAAAFATLAVGAGWWQVVDAQRLSREPDNPAVIAVARRALRGPIVDRDGRWLARSSRDANGEATREYRDDSISPVIGYASRQFGTAGLERSYNAELIGLGGSDAFGGLLDKFDASRRTPLGLRTTLDLRLQRAAVEALGADRGAVVMLDPTTGDVLALASTPTYDAAAIADPDTAARAFGALRDDESDPLLPRATLGRYVPGSVFKVVTAIAGLNTGSIEPGTTFEEQPEAEDKGLLVEGYRIRDGHHEQTDGTPLDLVGATEASCNIWYALAGLATGGDDLVGQAGLLGFGAPIPFDLPTAISRVTGGGGRAPGGFTDDVELASASFGQGETFVTPLQMALVASTVANDGVLMRPRLVAALTGEGPGTREIAPSTWRRVMASSDAQSVQAAMEAAVEGDLGRQFTAGAAVPGVPTAGKSGTAELGGKGEPHSWFIGFAPVENPRVAIAVLVEQGGRGGERAAPLAGSMMERYFEQYGAP